MKRPLPLSYEQRVARWVTRYALELSTSALAAKLGPEWAMLSNDQRAAVRAVAAARLQSLNVEATER